MKNTTNIYDWLAALFLALLVHLFIFTVAALPGNNVFFPYFIGVKSYSAVQNDGVDPGKIGGANHGMSKIVQAGEGAFEAAGTATRPYSLTKRYNLPPAHLAQGSMVVALPPLRTLFDGNRADVRSLIQKTATPKLNPPVFSANTIPTKPKMKMWEKVRENKAASILGDVFKDTVPLTYSREDLVLREGIFKDRVRQDILDGSLDMGFSSFIISTEYYYLSKALFKKGLQPSFTLGEAFSRYNDRLTMVKEGLPDELNAYSLIMILQRYAENKFYPENGSGLLLESLFHNLNDCEGGTKEILAYLDDLYPDISLGTNRGLLRTTTGEIIGHMQVFIGPGAVAGKIVQNDKGIVVEATRVSSDSILPYSAGDIFPLEDFVLRYYPDLVTGTPVAARLRDLYDAGADVEGAAGRKIVGVGDHPLKMGYRVNPTLLTDEYYDLANIRTQKIQNEFVKSKFAICDPRIDPLNVEAKNVFSSFVAVDKNLRKNLIGHYLASLPYWQNEVMPNWKKPPLIATYADFAGTLLAGAEEGDLGKYIMIDAENTVLLQEVESHKLLLEYLLASSETEKPAKGWLGRGSQSCKGRVRLTDQLLAYLFSAPERPGLFFLPDIGEKYSWTSLADAVVSDCLAVEDSDTSEVGNRNLLALLEAEAVNQGLSFRKVLFERMISRNPVAFPGGKINQQESMSTALQYLFTGRKNDSNVNVFFETRYSEPSSQVAASVAETIEESGQTGINPGLLDDAYDFLGGEWLKTALLQYAKRDDLRIELARANSLMQNSLLLLSAGDMEKKEINSFFLALVKAGVNENIQLAVALAHAQYVGMVPKELSKALVTVLESRAGYDSRTLISLLNYGLLKEDALAFYRQRMNKLLSMLPKPLAAEFFPQIAELIRTVHYFADARTLQLTARALADSLIVDFNSDARDHMDYGVVLNKLYLLAFLLEGRDGLEFRFSNIEFLEQFIRFAGKNPIGKIMISLVEKVYQGDSFTAVMQMVIDKELNKLKTITAELSGAKLDRENSKSNIPLLQDLLGDANVISYILFQMAPSAVSMISGRQLREFRENKKAKGFWYLENLHREIGKINLSNLGTGAENAIFAGDFYRDARVRESFSLLAYFAPDSENAEKIKFRKIKDIKSLKDLLKVKVTESSRKATRQDMSLLTLSLNGMNKPQEIRRAWEDTLSVVQKHMDMELTEDQKKYLFAPHYPYLALNNSGFIYSPEKVEDIQNAANWGGRNDILLSSYLHFKNLPADLPAWLLKTARQRSKSELGIIARLEQQSFLPMILECESDYEELPAALFKAKWQIRKPYGEDIFPATLLLLRLGYLDINSQGEFIVIEDRS